MAVDVKSLMKNMKSLVNELFQDFSAETALGLSIMLCNQVADGTQDDLVNKAQDILNSWRNGMQGLCDRVSEDIDSEEFMQEIDSHIKDVMRRWKLLWNIKPKLELI